MKVTDVSHNQHTDNCFAKGTIMRYSNIEEEDNAIIVGNTRILDTQMNTPEKVLAWTYYMIGEEDGESIKNFIQYCDRKGLVRVDWTGAKRW